MKYLIPFFFILFTFSCSPSENSKQDNKKQKTEIKSPKSKASTSKKTKQRKIGPFEKALKAELKLSNTQINQYNSIVSKYSQKIKSIRQNKELSEKAIRIARNKKKQEEELKKLLGKDYQRMVEFKKNWSTKNK